MIICNNFTFNSFIFRKLVKPMFKRSNSTKDLEADCDSPAVSRRGSRLSSRSGSSRCVDLQVEDAAIRGKKEEVHRRWRRVLSVSKAVGRYRLMSIIIENEGVCFILNFTHFYLFKVFIYG